MDFSSDLSVAVAIAAALGFLFIGVLLGGRRERMPQPAGSAASTDARLLAVENRLVDAEQKLNKISIEIQHLPTAETVAGMAVKIAEIGGDVKALQSSVQATNRLVERIDQWLLSNSKGSAQ
ncbi:DUF2730 family protein [Bosea sp. TWI1241]|uniref:DUF2730 family protein n=1 Tax=Bosea sp. TWI1241 TaxID=3148904 RepID=UPI0032078D1F